MSQKNQSKFEQSEKDKQSLKFAQNTVEVLKKIKQEDGVMDRFKMSINYLMGDHKIKNRSPAKGNDVWNKYAEIVENRLNRTTAQIPRWKFTPTTEQSVVTSDMLNQFLRDTLWEKDNWDEKAEDCLNEGAHAGSGFIFSDVDDEGWPTHEHVPIGAMLWDRQSRWKDVKRICKVTKQSIQSIKEDYGVTADPETSPNGETLDGGESYEVTAADPFKGPIVEGDAKDADLNAELYGEAYIYEVWFEDLKKETIPFKDEEVIAEHELLRLAQPIPFKETKRFVEETDTVIHPFQNHLQHIIKHREFQQTLDSDDPLILLIEAHVKEHEGFSLESKRAKYPFGRRIAYVGQNLLYDKPNNMPIMWKDRFIKWDWTKVPGKLIGKTLGHDLIDPQNAFNHRKNSITQNINMLNNGIRKALPGVYKHLKDTGKLNNLIGAVVEMRNKDDFTVDYGESLPQSTFADLAHSETFMDKNIQQVARGELPAAGTPNSAIENLIGQVNLSTGAGVRHFAMALERVARNSAVILREYLPDDTAISLYGDGEIEQKEWREVKEFINEENIVIDMESYNGTLRQEKWREGIEAYREGLFLRKHVLKYMDNPDKYQIIKETDELEAAKEELQIAYETIDERDKEINTMQNRLQTTEGKGNVGKN